jgi:FtsZ-binding cell division protein ZapB
MRKIFNKTFATIAMIVALLVLLPVETADACFSAKVKDTNVNVTLPINELEDLIEQLGDAGSSIVGDAGIQIQMAIDELSTQLELRIEQIKNAGSELIMEASTELRAIIDDLMDRANELLAEVNKMIQDNIQCIDEVLAARIAQITDSAYKILDKVDETLKQAIDRIYIRATMIVDTGANRAAIVIDGTLKMATKIGVFIITFILLFWLIRMLWKGSFPKVRAFAIGIPVFVVLLVGGGVYLLVSKSALARIVGQEIPIPNWQTSCNNGDTYYNNFIEKKNEGANVDELKPIGLEALEELNWCLYASVSPEVSTDTYEKINAISAILFPPAAPPRSGSSVSTTPCGEGGSGGGFSVNPAWVSGHTFNKIKVLNKLSDQNILKNQIKINPDIYKAKVTSLNNNIRITTINRSTVPVTTIDHAKINKSVYEKLKIK